MADLEQWDSLSSEDGFIKSEPQQASLKKGIDKKTSLMTWHLVAFSILVI
jgi:hypothetical protein